MRKFIFKSAIFIIPFSILYFVSFKYTNVIEGADLIRLGYFPNVYQDYRASFQSNTPIKYEKLSETKKRKFKILNIGDSFSDQKGEGYNNLLAADYSVLYVDRFLSGNQFQVLINLINGDFFESYEVEYVVLQIVERHIIDNIESLDFKHKETLSDLDSYVQDFKSKQVSASSEPDDNNPKFFSKNTLEFPLFHTFRYFFKTNYLSNELVYNVEMNSKSLFSINTNKLLFYYNDLTSVKKNNRVENAEKLDSAVTQISRMLAKKDIKLILLPAPDKYDLYYDYISDKKKITKPLFFDHMRTIKKEYIYVDAKAILTKKLNTSKDIYYYDDTHWSPVATKLIAAEISSLIKQSEEK